MKYLLLISISFLITSVAKAQAVIKISYDENGNRVKREYVCVGCRPINTNQDSSSSLTNSSDSAINARILQDQKKFSYQVYPNPSQNLINVKLDLSEKCSLMLTDLSGRVLYERHNVSNDITTIPINGYADGAYFIIINHDNKRSIVKVAKQSGETGESIR